MMADKKVETNKDGEVIVPAPKELVVSMAAAHFTREQVVDLLKQVDEAKAKGLTVRFV